MLFFLCFRPTIKFQDGSPVDPLFEPSADPLFDSTSQKLFLSSFGVSDLWTFKLRLKLWLTLQVRNCEKCRWKTFRQLNRACLKIWETFRGALETFCFTFRCGFRFWNKEKTKELLGAISCCRGATLIITLVNLQKCVGGFLLCKIWRILPGILLEDFSGHFFPQKWGEKIRRQNPRKKSGGPKKKNPRKIRSAKIRP